MLDPGMIPSAAVYAVKTTQTFGVWENYAGLEHVAGPRKVVVPEPRKTQLKPQRGNTALPRELGDHRHAKIGALQEEVIEVLAFPEVGDRGLGCADVRGARLVVHETHLADDGSRSNYVEQCLWRASPIDDVEPAP